MTCQQINEHYVLMKIPRNVFIPKILKNVDCDEYNFWNNLLGGLTEWLGLDKTHMVTGRVGYCRILSNERVASLFLSAGVFKGLDVVFLQELRTPAITFFIKTWDQIITS